MAKYTKEKKAKYERLVTAGKMTQAAAEAKLAQYNYGWHKTKAKMAKLEKDLADTKANWSRTEIDNAQQAYDAGIMDMQVVNWYCSSKFSLRRKGNGRC
jgi:hypothetical protein